MHSGHLPTTCSHVYSKLGFPVFCPNFVTSLKDERIKKDKFRFNIYGEKIEINLFLVKSTLMSLPYTRPMLSLHIWEHVIRSLLHVQWDWKSDYVLVWKYLKKLSRKMCNGPSSRNRVFYARWYLCSYWKCSPFLWDNKEGRNKIAQKLKLWACAVHICHRRLAQHADITWIKWN